MLVTPQPAFALVAPGSTTTDAVACLLVSATLVAVTVTVVVPLLTEGARNRPPLEIDPAVTDQVNAVFVVPCTAATNCCDSSETRESEVGEIETETDGRTTVTNTLSVREVSAALFAVIVTNVLLVTFGAVNRPLFEIVPRLVDQFTAVLLVPCTVAVNCLVAPDKTLTSVGETATVMVAAAGLAVKENIPATANSKARKTIGRIGLRRAEASALTVIKETSSGICGDRSPRALLRL